MSNIRSKTKKAQDKRMEAIIFDFDGTLYPSTAGIESQIVSRYQMCAEKRLALPKNEVLSLLRRYREEYRSSVLGLQEHHGIDPFEFYNELYDGLDISTIVPKPRLKDVLTALSKVVPLYILSNSNRSFVLRGLNHLGMQDLIKNVFTVEDNNFIRKPHKEVYIATVNRLGISAETIWMFDDIPSSLQTAKNVGFTTVLVGNGLRKSGFVDLHTRDEYEVAPEWCDYAAQDIAKFIDETIL
ncbi:MAG: HAD hydrolase-like protein [Candidatus Saccharibacteria bacterium]|nr:HAD hydrolase-like protein [Candidatus Saccharibacteria bacterium]